MEREKKAKAKKGVAFGPMEIPVEVAGAIKGHREKRKRRKKGKRNVNAEIVVARSCDRGCSCKLLHLGQVMLRGAPGTRGDSAFIVPLLQLARPKGKPSRINR